jgi:hypothetical protein
MTISNRHSAANLLNLYAWEVLKANTGMLVSQYDGKIPIVASGQEPDFNAFDRPYLVYGSAEDPSSDGLTRGGTLVYAIYSKSVGDINEIQNILISAFERQDESARDVNDFTSRTPAYIGIRFTSTTVAFAEGAASADQEGGRQAGTLTIRYSYVSNYNVTTSV